MNASRPPADMYTPIFVASLVNSDGTYRPILTRLSLVGGTW
jgi:hypothetical protein